MSPTSSGEVSDGAVVDLAYMANDLYWGSNDSVNRLADQLDLSKGALYELIKPYPVGIPCPHGDGELVYANRTARDRAFVTCPECGFEDEEGVVLAHMEDLGRTPVLELPVPKNRPLEPSDDFVLEKVVLGSALIGLAVGLGLASLFRRR